MSGPIDNFKFLFGADNLTLTNLELGFNWANKMTPQCKLGPIWPYLILSLAQCEPDLARSDRSN